jgi:hypothetical protein
MLRQRGEQTFRSLGQLTDTAYIDRAMSLL